MPITPPDPATDPSAAAEALRRRVGARFLWRGEPVRLRDLIPADGPMPVLVLECQRRTQIQPTYWGEAHRRVPDLIEIAPGDEDYEEAVAAVLQAAAD